MMRWVCLLALSTVVSGSEGSGDDTVWLVNDAETIMTSTGGGRSRVLDLDDNAVKTHKDQRDTEGETYQYQQRMVRLYQRVDGDDLYLDTSNHEVGQYIVENEHDHRFLNLIQYSLERNSKWDDDNQVVLRHEISLYYFCMTNCGVFYMSPTLTLDCVFVRELVQDITPLLEKIHLKKRYNGELVTINMEYGQINFKNHATMYSLDVELWKEYELTPVMDEANADICSSKYSMRFVGDADAPAPQVREADATVPIVCLTVSVIVLALVATTLTIIRATRKKRKQ